jgi:hypothetical protein
MFKIQMIMYRKGNDAAAQWIKRYCNERVSLSMHVSKPGLLVFEAKCRHATSSLSSSSLAISTVRVADIFYSLADSFRMWRHEGDDSPDNAALLLAQINDGAFMEQVCATIAQLKKHVDRRTLIDMTQQSPSLFTS